MGSGGPGTARWMRRPRAPGVGFSGSVQGSEKQAQKQGQPRLEGRRWGRKPGELTQYKGEEPRTAQTYTLPVELDRTPKGLPVTLCAPGAEGLHEPSHSLQTLMSDLLTPGGMFASPQIHMLKQVAPRVSERPAAWR